MSDFATAYVEIQSQLDPDFETKLVAQLKKVLDSPAVKKAATVKLSADTKLATAAIDRLQAKLALLTDKTINVAVNDKTLQAFTRAMSDATREGNRLSDAENRLAHANTSVTGTYNDLQVALARAARVTEDLRVAQAKLTDGTTRGAAALDHLGREATVLSSEVRQAERAVELADAAFGRAVGAKQLAEGYLEAAKQARLFSTGEGDVAKSLVVIDAQIAKSVEALAELRLAKEAAISSGGDTNGLSNDIAQIALALGKLRAQRTELDRIISIGSNVSGGFGIDEHTATNFDRLATSLKGFAASALSAASGSGTLEAGFTRLIPFANAATAAEAALSAQTARLPFGFGSTATAVDRESRALTENALAAAADTAAAKLLASAQDDLGASFTGASAAQRAGNAAIIAAREALHDASFNLDDFNRKLERMRILAPLAFRETDAAARGLGNTLSRALGPDAIRAIDNLNFGGGKSGGATGAASLFNTFEDGASRVGKAEAEVSKFSSIMSKGIFGLNGYAIAAGAAAVAIAAIAAAALAAEGAVAAFGITASEKLRTVKLELSDAGLSGDKFKTTLQSVRDLANTGLGLDAVGKSVTALVNAGLSSKAAVTDVKLFGDALAGAGLTGKDLATGVTTLTAAVVAMSRTLNPTTNDVASFADSLGVKTSAVIKQLAKDLDVTSAKAKALLAQGKVSGSQVSQAGLEAEAARPNTTNGLANAQATSFVQAFTAAKSKIQDSLADLFSNPKIVAGINDLADKVTAALAKLGPGAVDALTGSFNLLGKTIGPVAGFLAKVGDIINGLNTGGSGEFFKALGGTLSEIGRIASELLAPAFAALAKGIKDVAGSTLFADLTNLGRNLEPTAKVIGLIGGLLVTQFVDKVKLVVAAFHLLTPAINFVFQVFNDLIQGIAKGFDFVIGIIEKIVGVAAKFHIPGAEEAKGQLEDIHKQLKDIDGTNAVATVSINVQTNGNSLLGGLSGTPASSLLTGNGQDTLQAAADALSKRIAAKNKPKAPNGPAATGIGGSSAADAAKSAAETLKTARAALKKQLDGLVKDLSTDPGVGNVRSTLSALKQAIEAVATGALQDKLLKALSKTRGELVGLAKDIAEVQHRLEVASAAITSTFSSAQAFTNISSIASDLFNASDAVTGAVQSVQDLSRLRILTPAMVQAQKDAAAAIIQANKGFNNLNPTETFGSGVNQTIAGINAGLNKVTASIQQKTAQLAQFAANARKALAAGLDPKTVSELLSGGFSDANLALSQQLAQATPAQVAALNAASKAADAASASVAALAGKVAPEAEAVGQHILDGLIKGLDDTTKNKQLIAQMSKLGKALADAAKKALGIKSPSTVFEEDIAHMALEGAIRGLGSRPHLARLSAQAEALADIMQPQLSAVTSGRLSAAGTREAQQELALTLAKPSGPVEPMRLHPDDIRKLADALSGRPGVTIHAPVTQHVTGPANISEAQIVDRLSRHVANRVR